MFCWCSNWTRISLSSKWGKFHTFYSKWKNALWWTSWVLGKKNARIKEGSSRSVSYRRSDHCFALSKRRNSSRCSRVYSSLRLSNTSAFYFSLPEEFILLLGIRLQGRSAEQSPLVLWLKLQLASEEGLERTSPWKGRSTCPKLINFRSILKLNGTFLLI
jgi:hypothetical protein